MEERQSEGRYKKVRGVFVLITPEQDATLERLMDEWATSKSSLVRTALREFLRQEARSGGAAA